MASLPVFPQIVKSVDATPIFSPNTGHLLLLFFFQFSFFLWTKLGLFLLFLFAFVFFPLITHVCFSLFERRSEDGPGWILAILPAAAVITPISSISLHLSEPDSKV